MKLIALLMLMSSPLPNTPYCRGWAQGYQAGWCYKREAQCVNAVIPPCPPPTDARWQYFEDGFTRGMEKALIDRKMLR